MTCNPYSIEAHNRDTELREKEAHQRLLDWHVKPKLEALLKSWLLPRSEDPFFEMKKSNVASTQLVREELEHRAQFMGCVVRDFSLLQNGAVWEWKYQLLWYTWQHAAGTEQKLWNERNSGWEHDEGTEDTT